MFKNTITFLLLTSLLALFQILPAQTVPRLIYDVGFDSPGEGVLGPQPVRVIPATGPWRLSGDFSGLTAGADYFLTLIEGGEGFLEAQDTDAVVCFESDTLDISAYDSVTVSVDIEEIGDIESSDFVDFELLIDGISYPVVNFDSLGSATHTLIGDLPNDDDFGQVRLTSSGSGSQLVVKICLKNNAGTEQFRIDNVQVEAYSDTTAEPEPEVPDTSQYSFTLIDARTDQAIPGFDPIPEGANIDLAALGTIMVNFRFNTPDNPDRVKMRLERAHMELKRIENHAEFALFGNNGNNYFAPNYQFFRLLFLTKPDPFTLHAESYFSHLPSGSNRTTHALSFTLSIGSYQLREGLEASQGELTVYPNPTNGNFLVQGDFSGQEGGLDLQIINAMGQVIYQQNMQPSFTHKIDLGRASEGIYFVKVRGEDFQRVERLVLTK